MISASRTAAVLMVGVATMTVASPVQAATFISSVVSVTGGSGSGIFGNAPTIASALAAIDQTVYALGGATGAVGSITLKLDSGSVFDGAGFDLIAYDTIGLDESLQIEASEDGISFFGLGAHTNNFSVICSLAAPCTAGFDLAGSGLSTASFFRLTAVQGGCVFGFPECFDLDALEAANFREGTGAVPEPATWALMLLGFGAVGFSMRRRRTTQRVQFKF